MVTQAVYSWTTCTLYVKVQEGMQLNISVVNTIGIALSALLEGDVFISGVHVDVQFRCYQQRYEWKGL